MRLTKLEIKGFKSFPDKTLLEFKPGITGVVGPNGCGKSNILEAIRWVMGEQRPRSLRGTRMGDVIFNGSETRRPVGMAEVRMTLSVDPRHCPPTLQDYDEIMVSRRIFRDGESQYEINKVPCRLSDIVDLFLDTGLTQNSYAILEQGRVEMVVSSKPEDRRWLIEEAAGISRYKIRKESATKRLEQTQANLERLRDVLNEVRHQASALRRQARKAERYRVLRDKLRSFELAWNSHECKRLSNTIKHNAGELSRLRDAIIELQSRRGLYEGELQRQRQILADLDKRTIELHEEKHALEMALESKRVSAARSREKVEHLDSERERLRRDQQEKTILQEQCARSAAEAQQGSSGLACHIQDRTEALKEAAESLESLRKDLGLVQARLESSKTSLFQTLQTCAGKRNDREAAQRRIHEIVARQNRLANEKRLAEDESAETTARLSALEAELEEVGHSKEQCVCEKDKLASALKSQQALLESLRNRIRVLEAEYAGTASKLTSLEDLEKSGAHYDQSVQYVMAQRTSWPEGSLIGPLPELVEVEAGYEKALAAVLENRFGSIVVSSPLDAALGVEMLRSHERGRATFVPRTPRETLPSHPPPRDKEVTSLTEVIRFRAGFEELGQYLLGRCVVVENLEQALDLWSRNGTALDVATLEGDFLSRTGEVTGGAWDTGAERFFSTRREIEELRATLESLSKTLEAERKGLEKAELDHQETAAKKTSAEEAAMELRITEITKANEKDKIRGYAEALNRKTRTLSLEIEELDKEKTNLAETLAASQKEIAQLEQTIRDLKEQTTACKVESDALNNQREELARKHADVQVDLAKLEERFSSAARELQRNKELSGQLEAQLKAIEQQLHTNAEETQSVKKELIDAEENEKALMLSLKTCSERLSSLASERESLTERIQEIEVALAESASGEKALDRQIHEREIYLVQLKQELQHLTQKMMERYGVDPTNVTCEGPEADRAEIERLRKEIEGLGEVNLSAIREYKTVQERLAFLHAQESDLREAVKSLYETIGKITRTTNEMFMNAFQAINEKFQEIFAFLFQGGEAGLELVGPDNVLEAGIDIIARPPGKKRQAMGLLSGGEKALTAIALIFAIFLTKPSPFCLLDEVDAPLDDGNIGRFNDMLRSLGEKTQFIVITHNKRTMEVADCLYGITMEEPGASTLVSVDLAR